MLRVLPLLTAILLAAAGCAGPPDEGADVVERSADGRFEQVALDDVQIWRSAQASGDFLGAEVVGMVGYDVDCGAYLHSEEFDLRYPVVWPEGTAIAETEPVTLQLADGPTVAVGDVVTGGGGYHSDLALFPDGCADSGETAVYNASGDVEVVEVADDHDQPPAVAEAGARWGPCRPSHR